MTPAPPFNPYPGLRPFRESEAHLFFGRSTHVDEVLAELARSRFVAVMGASASGKSSLVNAGCAAGAPRRVRRHGRGRTGGSRPFRPGANPIHNLARALAVPEVLGAEDADPLVAAAQVEATLRRSGLGLADAARQSEELWTAAVCWSSSTSSRSCSASTPTATEAGLGDDAEPFVQLLIEATRDERCARRRDPHDAVGLPRRLLPVPRASRSHQPGALPRSPADPIAAPGGDHRRRPRSAARRSARDSCSGSSTTPAPIPTCCPWCSTP